MDKDLLSNKLKEQSKDVLIHLLLETFDNLSSDSRFEIFNHLFNQDQNNVDILRDIKVFYEDSLSKKYYAPFNIDSKNFTHIPDKTKLWCNKIGDYYHKTCELTDMGDHKDAVECFDMLYYLEENMCEEIVFADELGGWMIPVKHSFIMPKYIESISKACSPLDFKKKMHSLMLMNDYYFNKFDVYMIATECCTAEQISLIVDLNPGEQKHQ